MIYPLQHNLKTPRRAYNEAAALHPGVSALSLTAAQPMSLDYTHRRSAWRLLKLLGVLYAPVSAILRAAAERV